MRVEVSDRGIPVRTQRSSATVRVNIIRNENVPEIDNLPESIDILQTLEQGSVLYPVFGSDDDDVRPFNQTRYEIIGDDGAERFFSIDEAGVISLSGDINEADGEDVEYRVSKLYLE